jgi:MmyB-like transcription regulator ligand binding domain
VRPQLKLLLETLRPNPAYITSRTLDLLAANPGVMALCAGIGDWPAAQRNIGRFLFLHPAARDIYAGWDNQIRGCVARLRALAGTDPDAPDLAGLVGGLLLKSPDFAKLSERYDVTRRTAAPSKPFHHPRPARSPSASRACNWKAPPASASAATSPNPAPPTTISASTSAIVLSLSGNADTASYAAYGHDVLDQADENILDGLQLPCVAHHDGHPGLQAQRDPDVVRLEPGGFIEAVDGDGEWSSLPLEVVDRSETVCDAPRIDHNDRADGTDS